MLTAALRFEHRRWAVEGSNGIGRHVAQRLLADGEPVVDGPAKLAARARVFDTGNGRKTDPADAIGEGASRRGTGTAEPRRPSQRQKGMCGAPRNLGAYRRRFRRDDCGLRQRSESDGSGGNVDG